VSQPPRQPRKRISLELPEDQLQRIDALKQEWGLRSRGDILARLLEELFEEAGSSPSETPDGDEAPFEAEEFDQQSALVLLGGGELERLVAPAEAGPGPHPDGPHPVEPAPSGAGAGPGAAAPRPAGIDLPGFVRSRSSRLRRSLRGPATGQPIQPEGFVTVDAHDLHEAMAEAEAHWVTLYGHPPGAEVLEAAMVWLAHDIWRQSEAAEGRPFAWSLVTGLLETMCPVWQGCEPSFARVMAAAGLLEDPFGAASLKARMPSLIRRFVHRFRRRRHGTSFEALQHTMTLHGALQLLGLPTTPGEAMTLRRIREAYREQAMNHHPDSGGSTDGMRRLNEAYQLLKECYRARA
jgi:hypothetical protein